MVDLSDADNPDRLGHISTYELNNGDTYKLYFLEARYFSLKQTDKEGNLVRQESANAEYHYSLDMMFNNKDRHLGWDWPHF